MKLRELLMEGPKEDLIISKQGDKIEAAARNDISARHLDVSGVLERLKGMDPTGGKYLQFLVNKYIAGQLRIEDKEKVLDTLTRFVQVLPTLPNKDINQFKKFIDLVRAVAPKRDATVDATPVSKKQQAKMEKAEGADVVVQGPGIKIVHIKTPQAAKFYRAGTRWCTTDENTFLSYAKQGNIYVIMAHSDTPYTNTTSGITTNTRKFQFHYDSSQIMDEDDRPLSENSDDIELLSQYPEWYQFVDMMIKKHHYDLSQV